MKTFQTLQSSLLDLYVHAHKCSLRPSIEFLLPKMVAFNNMITFKKEHQKYV